MGNRVRDLLDYHCHGRGGLVRLGARKHFVDDHAHGVHIAAPIHLFTLGLFRAHIGRCADNRTASHGRILGLCHFGDAKIGNKGLTGAVKKDVAWFQIAVDDSFKVGFIQRRCQAFNDLGSIRQVHRSFSNRVCQRAACHAAHDKIGLAVFVANVVNGYDGLVFQRRNGLGLTFKTDAELRVMQQFPRQDFQGHLAFETWIIGQVHGSHTAASKLFFDFVPTDFLLCHSFLTTGRIK